MTGQLKVELTIYEQRLRLLWCHRQQWRDLSAFVVTSCHELHEQHRQQRRQLINATVQERQVLLQRQVGCLLEQHHENQAFRDQLQVKQKGEWTALNMSLNRCQEHY